MTISVSQPAGLCHTSANTRRLPQPIRPHSRSSAKSSSDRPDWEEPTPRT